MLLKEKILHHSGFSIIPLFIYFSTCLLNGQSHSDFEGAILSPADGTGRPALYFSNATLAQGHGHIASLGTDPLMAYHLARQTGTDFFGNPNSAFVIEHELRGGGIPVSGSTVSSHLAENEGSLIFLFKTPSALAGYQSLISRGNYNNQDNNYLELRIDNQSLRIGHNSNALTTIGILEANTWYFVALTFSISEQELRWHLGQAGSGSLNTGKLFIVGSGDPEAAIFIGGKLETGRFLGKMQDIAIWNRVLSSNAIESQFNALRENNQPSRSHRTQSAPVPVPAQRSQPSPLKPDNRPSIVLIVADDLGYGDLESYGDYALVPTPNMDRLAERGVRFTDAYATAPVCGPSRYGFMTGIYQQRLGVFDNRDAWSVIPEPDNRIPEGVSVFNQPLAEAGYVTGIVGKWNLPNYPNTTFCETHSVIHFEADYFPDETGHFVGVDEPVARSSSKRYPFWGPEREGDEYLTDRFGRQAVDFINRHSDRPFFLYLGFNAPHSPLEAKKSHREAVAHLPSEALRFYAAMVLSFDENVGLILDALEENGLTENTLVVLTSDHGPSMGFNVGWPEDWPRELLGSAGPLSGHKGQLLEGGIRVPMLLSWPKHIPQGVTYNEYVSLLDLFPTFTAAGQVPLEKIPQADRLDGVNLLPYLVGRATGAPHERLLWLIGNNAAVRQGDWKLRVHNDRASLFNLVQDIGEKNDVASDHPELVQELTNHLKNFQAELPEKANPVR